MAKPKPAGIIAGTIVFILLTFLFFLIRFRSALIPDYDGSEELNGLQSPARISWSETGFPTINAANLSDGYQSVGYLHAQDFLFLMDYKRKLAQGRLSAWFGPDYLQSDLWYRSVNLPKIADSLWISASPEAKIVLEAYSRGINEWIRINHQSVGYEYAELNTLPDFWEPSHSILIELWHLFSKSSYSLRKDILNELLAGRGVYPDLTPVVADSVSGSLSRVKNPELALGSPLTDWQNVQWKTMGIGSDLNGSGKPWVAAGLNAGLNAFQNLAPVKIDFGTGNPVSGMLFPGSPRFRMITDGNRLWFSGRDSIGIKLEKQKLSDIELAKTPVSIEISGSESHYDYIRTGNGYFSVPGKWVGIAGLDQLWTFRLLVDFNPAGPAAQHEWLIGSRNPDGLFRTVPEPALNSLMLDSTNFSFSTLDPVFAATVTSDSLQSDLFFRFLERGYFSIQDFWDWWSVSFGLNEKVLADQIILATSFDSSTVVRETRVYLTEWVGEYADRSIGASLYEVSRYYFFRNWLEPLMGDELFHEWYAIREWSRNPKLLSAIAKADTLPFTSIPKRVQLILAFRESIRYLQENFGVTRFVWRWENLNNAWLVHPLHFQKPDQNFLVDYKEEPRPLIDRYDKPHFQRKYSDQVTGLINWMVLLPDSGVFWYSPTGYSATIASPFYSKPDSLSGLLLPIQPSTEESMTLNLVPAE